MVKDNRTPAEMGLMKVCNGRCGRRLPLYHFYIRSRKLTLDGRRYRSSRCSACFSELRGNNRRHNKAKAKARQRAMVRLTHLCPELFAVLLQEELQRESDLSEDQFSR